MAAPLSSSKADRCRRCGCSYEELFEASDTSDLQEHLELEEDPAPKDSSEMTVVKEEVATQLEEGRSSLSN